MRWQQTASIGAHASSQKSSQLRLMTRERESARVRECESARGREGAGEREKRPVCERGRGLWPDACEGIGKRELVHEDTKQVVGPA